MSCLVMAREYLAKGFSVIPLHPRDKKPLIQWKEFQTRKATNEELIQWFSGDNNIGIVTGSISGVTVIDCDSADAVKLANSLGLPIGLAVKTGKGFHFYFQHQDGVSNFQKRDDLPGIDLRGEGGYVVAPPSIHPNGAEYAWEPVDRTIHPLPKWVLSERKDKKPIEVLYRGASAGGRNDSLARLSGVWVKSLPLAEALDMALTWNQRNTPPLAEAEIRQTVESIYRAEKSKPQPMPGFREVGNIELDLMRRYKNGVEPGIETGWSNLDPLYSIRRGEWTLVTGVPSHGKSTWLDNLYVNAMRNDDWKFAVFSPENHPLDRHLAALLEIYSGRPFADGFTQRMNEAEIKTAMNFMTSRLFFITPPDGEETVDRILETTHELIRDKKIDGLVIDPWNEVQHWPRPDGQNETEYILSQLSKIRKFARKNRIHIWIVAHPAKLMRGKDGSYPIPTAYDVSGSAHWRNVADNVICLWRDPADTLRPNEIHVQKIRFRDVGRVGMAQMNYDVVTGRYLEPQQACQTRREPGDDADFDPEKTIQGWQRET